MLFLTKDTLKLHDSMLTMVFKVPLSVEWSTIYDQVRICRVCSHFADSLDPTLSRAEIRK